MSMSIQSQPRMGAVLRAGLLAVACGLPLVAQAGIQVGPMDVWWPNGGATTAIGNVTDSQAPILSNLYWQGEDQVIQSHAESDTPLHNTADAAYSVSLTSTGFDMTMEASVKRGINDEVAMPLVPRGQARVGAGAYFQLSTDADIRIQGVAGTTAGFGYLAGVLERSHHLTLTSFITVNGEDKELTVWSSTFKGALDDDPLRQQVGDEVTLHLKAGVTYQLWARTAIDLYWSHPGQDILPALSTTLNVSVAAVPEPSQAWLWCMGLIGMGGVVWRGRAQRR